MLLFGHEKRYLATWNNKLFDTIINKESMLHIQWTEKVLLFVDFMYNDLLLQKLKGKLWKWTHVKLFQCVWEQMNSYYVYSVVNNT